MPKTKASSKERREQMEAAKAYADSMNIQTVLPAFPKKVYDSFEAFDDDHASYSAQTNTSGSIRTSNKREWRNKYVLFEWS
jgi:hypothetical protein